jgi:hypothetical protein
MKASVELIYKAMPSDQEIVRIRDAGMQLTTDPNSVSVWVVQKDSQYPVLLEFIMPTQAQYKVVDQVSHGVQRWLMESYDDICIRFGK